MSAEFLFTTVPETGHTIPLTPFAAELVRRGNRVRWYTGSRLKAVVEAAGAEFLAMPPEWEPDQSDLAATFPERAKLKGLAQARFDLENLFFRPAGAHVEALREILSDRPAQVVVGDTWSVAASWLGELSGVPTATIGVNPLLFPSLDVPPAGLGLTPWPGGLGRLRNSLLNLMVRNVALASSVRVADDVREGVGLPRAGRNPLEYTARTDLYLQLCPPAFEFPRRDLPSRVHFLGYPIGTASSSYERPSWWPRLSETRPVVLVTQGTIATEPANLLRPAIEGVAGRDVFIVAVTGGASPDVLGPLPANVVGEPFIPFDELLPHVDVMVTNGGFGGVQRAIAHGIPLVVAGASEDKKEVNVRVRSAGIGVDLGTDTPAPDAIGRAVDEVVNQPRYREAVARVRSSTPPGDPVGRGADLLETLL
jgi:MGT family glycosyltransferase